MKAMNPAGMFPMIEVEQGVAICGTVAICKHLARLNKSSKLLGGDLLQSAQVDQWVNWTYTTLLPTADSVMSGILGTS
jgi:glutathione S-transferase